jgi:hypothetical protein
MNYLYGTIAVFLILAGVEQYGEHRVQIEWDLERARNKAIAQQEAERDKQANAATEAQRKKDIENAKSEGGRIVLNNWLRKHGLLPDGSPVSGSGSNQTNCTGNPNDTSDQSGTGERIADFARGCALDALHVLQWQEWSIREGLETR